MSFDWASYLKIAEQLKGWSIDSSLNEAKFRTSISRAYYSAFNIVKDSLSKKRGINFQDEEFQIFRKKWGSHQLLINIFYTSNSVTMKSLGSELEDLKEMRVDADYRVADYKKIRGNFLSFSHQATSIADGIIKDLTILDDLSAKIDLDKLRELIK